MGVDVEYQAMPDDCRLLERARVEPEFGSNLSLFRFYAQNEREEFKRQPDDKSFSHFVTEMRKVVEEHPGIEERNLDLGRRWDVIHYLLSEERRTGERDNKADWAKRVVHGGEELSEKAVSGIGVPITYLQPAEVSAISKRLDQITPEMFREHWDAFAMLEAGVYKIHQTDGELELQWIEEDFEKLRDFYRLVAGHNEGILTFWQ